jgi:hypothetical protein
MVEYPPCRLPILTHTVNGIITSRQSLDRIASALNELLKKGGISQSTLCIGLCNALSYCIGAIIDQSNTTVHQEFLVLIEQHLHHMTSVMSEIRRTHSTEYTTTKFPNA